MSSGENDSRVQIPTQAWITSNIVMNIDSTLESNPEISLREYVKQQKDNTNIWRENESYPIYNHGYLLMMAYAFIVVPKESIKDNSLISSEVRELLSKIEISINEENNGTSKEENIIRHIRNSISHADYTIDPENNILIFHDRIRTSETFRGEMSISDFVSFMTEYFKAYYDVYYRRNIKNMS